MREIPPPADGVRPLPRSFQEERTLGRELVQLLPNFAKLAKRLLTDRRVPVRRKLLLGALVAYLVSPVDVIPDFIPGLGQMDDVLVAVLVLHALLTSVDEDVLLEHWDGRPDVILLVRRAVGLFARRFPVRLDR
jgi:uncharacterized membrane protein YkvA (DUF1232 family)